MSDISSRILALIQQNELSYGELSVLTQIPKSALQRYATGETEKIPLNRLEIISKALRTTPAYLMGWTEEPLKEVSADNLFKIEKRKFPLLGNIACGEPILAKEEIELYVQVGTCIIADFCLRAKGDSMVGARIYDGDIVFIRKQEMVENGEIAAVLIGEEATLKRVSYYPEKNLLILKPENSDYEDFVFSGEELNQVRIIGKAIAFQSDVK